MSVILKSVIFQSCEFRSVNVTPSFSFYCPSISSPSIFTLATFVRYCYFPVLHYPFVRSRPSIGCRHFLPLRLSPSFASPAFFSPANSAHPSGNRGGRVGAPAKHKLLGAKGTRAHHGWDTRTWRDVSSYLFTYLPRNYDTPVELLYIFLSK